MKSKVIKSYNLPADRLINATIDAKPYFLIVFITFLGCLFFLWKGLAEMAVVAGALGVIGLFFLPQRVLMEFSPDYLVLYNRVNHDDCSVLYYQDIVSWSYVTHVNANELLFELTDGQTVHIESFRSWRLDSLMNRYLPNKRKKKRST